MWPNGYCNTKYSGDKVADFISQAGIIFKEFKFSPSKKLPISFGKRRKFARTCLTNSRDVQANFQTQFEFEGVDLTESKIVSLKGYLPKFKNQQNSSIISLETLMDFDSIEVSFIQKIEDLTVTKHNLKAWLCLNAQESFTLDNLKQLTFKEYAFISDHSIVDYLNPRLVNRKLQSITIHGMNIRTLKLSSVLDQYFTSIADKVRIIVDYLDLDLPLDGLQNLPLNHRLFKGIKKTLKS